MPIYEYVCENCGQHLEVFQSIRAEPLIECEHCHQSTLKKLVSVAGFRLKGSGWYETDFKKEEKKKNLASHDDKPVSTEKKEASTSKPDSKTDTSTTNNNNTKSNTSSGE